MEYGTPHLYSKDPMNENDYSQLISEFENKQTEYMKLTYTSERRNHIKNNDAHFLYPGEKALLKTLNKPTQLERMNPRIPMRRHVKSINTTIQGLCINEPYAAYTWSSTTTSYEGYNCVQIFIAQGQR